jgi:hypothetical protein
MILKGKAVQDKSCTRVMHLQNAMVFICMNYMYNTYQYSYMRVVEYKLIVKDTEC